MVLVVFQVLLGIAQCRIIQVRERMGNIHHVDSRHSNNRRLPRLFLQIPMDHQDQVLIMTGQAIIGPSTVESEAVTVVRTLEVEVEVEAVGGVPLADIMGILAL